MGTRFVFVAASLALLGACGDSSTDTESDDLTAGGKKLIGAYIESGAGKLRALVLTSETVTSNANRFFADVDTGIECIKAPCPSVERVEGTFTGGTKTITLKSPTASPHALAILGKYNYQAKGEKLTISRKGFQQSLERVDSYCGGTSPALDCGAQDLIHIDCVGGWTCSEAATCEFSCGALDPTDPNFCKNGTIVKGPDSFISSADGLECKMPSVHCVTKDQTACPQLSPLPPDFCSDGTVVSGSGTFISSADGLECKMPSVHCVTKDDFACPQLSPLPPDFCSEGTLVKGPDSFVSSADDKECKLPSVHCLTKDSGSCPQF